MDYAEDFNEEDSYDEKLMNDDKLFELIVACLVSP